jgi:hypothetical protein
MRTSIAVFSAAAAVLGGCATPQQMLDGTQAQAVSTALQRGQFELNCPSAQAVLISREQVQPALQGPWVGGVLRNEYTVGVDGCGKRTTFVVICPVGGSGCFAAGPGPFILNR